MSAGFDLRYLLTVPAAIVGVSSGGNYYSEKNQFPSPPTNIEHDSTLLFRIKTIPTKTEENPLVRLQKQAESHSSLTSLEVLLYQVPLGPDTKYVSNLKGGFNNGFGDVHPLKNVSEKKKRETERNIHSLNLNRDERLDEKREPSQTEGAGKPEEEMHSEASTERDAKKDRSDEHSAGLGTYPKIIKTLPEIHFLDTFSPVLSSSSDAPIANHREVRIEPPIELPPPPSLSGNKQKNIHGPFARKRSLTSPPKFISGEHTFTETFSAELTPTQGIKNYAHTTRARSESVPNLYKNFLEKESFVKFISLQLPEEVSLQTSFAEENPFENLDTSLFEGAVSGTNGPNNATVTTSSNMVTPHAALPSAGLITISNTGVTPNALNSSTTTLVSNSGNATTLPSSNAPSNGTTSLTLQDDNPLEAFDDNLFAAPKPPRNLRPRPVPLNVTSSNSNTVTTITTLNGATTTLVSNHSNATTLPSSNPPSNVVSAQEENPFENLDTSLFDEIDAFTPTLISAPVITTPFSTPPLLTKKNSFKIKKRVNVTFLKNPKKQIAPFKFKKTTFTYSLEHSNGFRCTTGSQHVLFYIFTAHPFKSNFTGHSQSATLATI
ncbi:hypothetical protein Bealeia1_01591 [Candidatus Bealeia paramacronuclearis]|uniref:Uncharacterized protein n=1 Tax=Candidatus Bealeia paramacronuclearis TaxID=1921001 RepID=A0ABZ2C4L3_9PROT|nr:hypothetical protein [Candidatus Bealeia paramacronuclearis]